MNNQALTAYNSLIQGQPVDTWIESPNGLVVLFDELDDLFAAIRNGEPVDLAVFKAELENLQNYITEMTTYYNEAIKIYGEYLRGEPLRRPRVTMANSTIDDFDDVFDELNIPL